MVFTHPTTIHKISRKDLQNERKRRAARQARRTASLRTLEGLENRALLSGSGWAYGIGTTSAENAAYTDTTATDPDGNFYVANQFRGSLDLDDDGQVDVENSGSEFHSFIARYSLSGELTWAHSIGDSSGGTFIRGLTTDANGNVYVTGGFNGDPDLDGDGQADLTLPGGDNSNTFIAMFEPNSTTGGMDLAWAEQISGGKGGQNFNHASGIVVNDGSLYVTGRFGGSVDFDPGSDSTILDGDDDSFLARYSASPGADGHLALDWIRPFTMENRDPNNPFDLKLHDDGAHVSVYLIGSSGSDVTFDGGANVDQSLPGPVPFLVSYSGAGDLQWTQAVRGDQRHASLESIVADTDGVYLTGYFEGTVDFDDHNGTSTEDTDSDVLTATASDTEAIDGFVARYVPTTGDLDWLKQFGDQYGEGGFGLALDGETLYVGGGFSGSVDFDGTLLTSREGADTTENEGFVAALDLGSRSFTSAVRMGGDGGLGDIVKHIESGGSGLIYAFGEFDHDDGKDADFPSGDRLTTNGGRDLFMTQFSLAPLPGVTVAPTSGLETTEAGGTAAFDVVLNTQPTDTVTVPITSDDITEGTVSTSSLTFTTTDWDQPQTVIVTGIDDTALDGDIAYAIVVGPASSNDPDYDDFDPADVTVINLDDEVPPPSLSIDDVTVTEGNSGTTQAIFTVTRSGDTSGSSGVDYLTADGTADAGSDYTATGGTLAFLPGETIQTITVTVLGDTDVEPDETFVVDLSNPVGATIADSQGLGTITNDDATSIQVAAIAPDSVPKGSSVSVTITGAGFVAGASVTFENSSGPAPSASNVVVVDASTMTATITAPNGGPKRDGAWDARVTNPDGSSAVLVQGFTVTSGENLTAASDAGPGSNADPLYRWQLRFALRSAHAFWRDAGADLSRLGPLDVRIADLPGTTLGQADGTTITLDRDAAGHGWFLDPTPGEHSEFPIVADPTTLMAEDSAPAVGRYDVLTVALHELGHLLGFEHEGHGVMAETLDPGMRQLPAVHANKAHVPSTSRPSLPF